MLKRILVALDPDTDTAVATRYAAEIASRHGARVTGLAVVDMGSIAAGARGGGIGSMYYAEKLRESLTGEARDVARQLIEAFEADMHDAGVDFVDYVREGVPFQRIIEDMKYHDLLVVGKEPHFFYSHPEQTTKTLARVVRSSVAPTFVTSEGYQPVNRVLIAYDGSDAAARALRSYAQSQPFGTEPELELLNVYSGGAGESELMLGLAESFLGAHGFSARASSLKSDDIPRTIVEHAQKTGADLVVLGAHAVSKLREFAFGSTTSTLLEECPVALFLDD